MWSLRFDQRRPHRLLEEPPNVTRKKARHTQRRGRKRRQREKLSDFRQFWRPDPAVSDEVRKTEARPAGRAWVMGSFDERENKVR